MKLFISRLHYKKELDFSEKIIVFLLQFLGIFYTMAVNVRNKMYDKKLLPSYNAKEFVVSVGNITTGGTGKTPVTAEIVRYFLEHNKKVAVISRGYGARISNKNPTLISSGSGPEFSASDAGDEPVWLASNCKGAQIVTCADRIKAEKYLKEAFNPDIIVLDDAFQHRKMRRDLDIVLIDAKNKFGNKLLLPAGPLREEISSLSRADKIVVVNKGVDSRNALKYCDYLKNKLNKEIYLCKIVPDYVYNILTGEELDKEKRIMAFSAIGQPEGFYDFLKKGYKLSAILEFEDHHRYEKDDISKIIHYAQEENIDSIVTTEKDAVKLIDIIRDIELPVSFYALKLKAFMDLKEICGR